MSEPHARSDHELDAFVAAEVREGRRVRRIPVHRIALTATVVFAMAWLCSDLVDEIRYHFSAPEVHDLGDAALIPPNIELPVDVHVRLSGVLGNKAATISGLRPGSFRRGPIQVRQLLGSPVFVEFDQDAHLETYQEFTKVTVEGRLADFGPTSELVRVRDYFYQRFGMKLPDTARVLIVGEKPGAMWRDVFLVGLCALVALTSIVFLVRAARTQIEED